MTPSWHWEWPYQLLLQSYLERLASGEITRLMLTVPPRHGKSELATVRYSAWLLERNPSLRVVIGAYNQTLANKFSRKCKRICTSRLQMSDDRTAVEDWETAAGGGVRAVGVGAGITGQGGDHIWIDDPVKNREEANSETYREKVWDWYRDDLYTRLEPGATLGLIMTRWHEDDLAGRILASEDAPHWTVLNLPAIAEGCDPLGRTVGEALCPARYDESALASIKQVLGSWSFEALYQGRPSPIEGGIIKKDWLRYYDELPPQRDWGMACQSWDMAFKDLDTSSFVVGTVWVIVGGDFYLVDLRREHLDLPGSIEAVKAMSARYPMLISKLVEDKANGPAVIQMLQGRVSGLIAWPNDGRRQDSKEARLSAVSPLFEAGNVYLPSDAPWLDDYVHELCGFPGTAHDDQVDSTSMALIYLSRHTGTASILTGSRKRDFS